MFQFCFGTCSYHAFGCCKWLYCYTYVMNFEVRSSKLFMKMKHTGSTAAQRWLAIWRESSTI
jgi:hypothetical protein